MIKLLRYTVSFFIFLGFTNSLYAQFPYIESFRAATAPGITFGGAPAAFLTASGSSSTGGTPIDPVGDGYLRLTSNSQNQKGYAYSNSNFPSKYGLRVDFEYYIYGGDGADGISFFLFDATANPFVIGGFGGSLGYAQITTTSPISPGVSKGYLAIGLDEYGNFSNPIEGRQGGIPGFRPGSVTLRGKGNGDSLDPENYKFLTTALVQDFGFPLVGDVVKREPSTTSEGYRRVLMELEPDPVKGYYITVKITTGGSSLVSHTVINRYYYAEAAPANLRYGFASSTGDQRNYHEVRNVKIEVYDNASLVPSVATNDTFNACRGNATTFDVSANDVSNNSGAIINKNSIDIDPGLDGVQNTYTVAGKGTFSVTSAGDVLFTPLNSFVGSVTGSYTISDSYSQLSNVASITLNYTEPTLYPTAGSNTVKSITSGITTYTLDGSILPAGYSGSWSQVSGPNIATFNNPSLRNAVTGNLMAGTYVFRWTIRAPEGCQSAADVEVHINLRPVTVADNISTNLNTDIQIAILDNDSDPDGNNTLDRETVVLKTTPQNGTIVLDPANGTVIYRPNNGYTGSDSFTYTVKDIYGAESNISIVNIAVSLKPVGSNDNAETFTNTNIIIPVVTNDSGSSGATVVDVIVPINVGNAVINADRTITYSPPTDKSGRFSFTYKLRSSGGAESDPITVTVSVKPTGTQDTGNTFSFIPITIDVKNNDVSKDNTTVIVNSSPVPNGSVTLNSSGFIVYTPTGDFSGKDRLNYHLRTSDGLDSQPIEVNINVRPVGKNDNVQVPINAQQANINVKDNDISKLGTSIVLLTGAANQSLHGTAVVNTTTNVIQYSPTTGFAGLDSLKYILRTADGLASEPINLNIFIRPAGSPDEATTVVNAPVTIPVINNDISGSVSSVILVTQPLNGSVALNSSGIPSYTPNPLFQGGKETFTYVLRTAGGAESESISVLINVRPAGSPDNMGGISTQPVEITVKENDFSKTNTTVLINTSPVNNSGTVTVNPSGTITFTPTGTFSGPETFTYILRTADGLSSDPILVTLTSKPAGSPDLANTNTNAPVTIPVKDNDASKLGTSVILPNSTSTNGGTITLDGSGVPVYTPRNGFSGKDTFIYRLQNTGNMQSDPIQVTVNVKPVGSADSKSTPVNTVVTFDIKSNDASKDGTTVILNTDPTHGTVTFSGLNATFTPTNGYIGNDSFTYLLRTADGLESAPVTVSLTITPSIPAPNVTIEAPVEKTTTIDIPIPPGGTYEITVPPLHGTITKDPTTGKPIYTPNPGYTGPDEFTYIIKDSNGNSSGPGKVTLTIYKPAKIGIAKALTSNVTNQDGSVRLNFLFTLVNYGDAAIDRISLTDNLALAFPGRTITINRLNGSGTLRVNTAYNGTSNTNMLLATSTLATNFKEVLELDITLSASAQGGTFNNTATAQGFSTYDGNSTTDISTTGLTPDPITAGDVTPQTPTQIVILVAPNLTIPTTSGQPVTIPLTVPPGGSVIITRPPTNGTITFDSNTGQPIYTPNPGYRGPDEFTYVIRDANGNLSPQGTVSITVTVPAKIGLAKKLVSQVKNLDGSYNLRFLFTLVNIGDFAVDRVSLNENLALAFPETSFQIINITTASTGSLKINPAYNGTGITNMLLPTSTINKQFKEEVTLELKVILDKREGLFNNFATAAAFSTNDGSQLNDQSTDGFNPDPLVPGDFTPSILTPITLDKGTFKIPAGFSPNNDGINDFFVVENALGKKINLEVFNRWGNRIFRSTDYQNNWSGKSTEGIHLGEDVPVGTYYYVITIDGKDKRAGYITINR